MKGWVKRTAWGMFPLILARKKSPEKTGHIFLVLTLKNEDLTNSHNPHSQFEPMRMPPGSRLCGAHTKIGRGCPTTCSANFCCSLSTCGISLEWQQSGGTDAMTMKNSMKHRNNGNTRSPSLPHILPLHKSKFGRAEKNAADILINVLFICLLKTPT